MQLEELVGALDVLRVDQAVRERRAVADAEQPRADAAADRVVHAVAENRGANQQEIAHPRVEHAGRAERADREEQRIARQKRRDDQAGLGKDDREQDAVDPGAVLLDELEQVSVEMKDKIDELRHSEAGLLAGGRLDVSDDEQCLSRAHEAELAARDFLDGRGIFPQPARLFAERRILVAQPREVGRQLIILFPRSHRGHQALIADERIDDEHADDEEEEAGENAAAAPLGALRVWV